MKCNELPKDVVRMQRFRNLHRSFAFLTYSMDIGTPVQVNSQGKLDLVLFRSTMYML